MVYKHFFSCKNTFYDVGEFVLNNKYMMLMCISGYV